MQECEGAKPEANGAQWAGIPKSSNRLTPWRAAMVRDGLPEAAGTGRAARSCSTICSRTEAARSRIRPMKYNKAHEVEPQK